VLQCIQELKQAAATASQTLNGVVSGRRRVARVVVQLHPERRRPAQSGRAATPDAMTDTDEVVPKANFNFLDDADDGHVRRAVVALGPAVTPTLTDLLAYRWRLRRLTGP